MKVLLAVVAAIGMSSLPIQQVAACSCAASAPEEAAAFADAVFAGTVVGETPIGADTGPAGAMAATGPAPMPAGGVVYTFAVDGVAKGTVGPRIDVLAGGDGASCGMSFGMDDRWLVFTTWDGAMHGTGLCSGNVALEAGAEAPLPMEPPTDGAIEAGDAPSGQIPLNVLLLFGVVAVVVAVSWLSFRRERRS